MKPFNGYNETQVMTNRPKLPVGAYLVEIKKAEEKVYNFNGESFSKLEISFDIAEGEYKDFYADDYRSQSTEDKKWKGVLRQTLPKDDGSKEDEKSKRFFKTMIAAIEDSNTGYHWDWHEETLKGLKVGCVFQNQEWAFNGRCGWKAQPYSFISTESYKSGEFYMPADKPLTNKSPTTIMNQYNTYEEIESVSDTDLPF